MPTSPTGLACSDPHSGVATCTGPATLDTSTSGQPHRHLQRHRPGRQQHPAHAGLHGAGTAAAPAAPAKDLVNIRIPELGYTVDGAVTSGGFEITKSANGQVTSVSGTATFTRTNGNRVTVTILAVRIAGVWIGAINVNDPSARVNVSAGTLSRSGCHRRRQQRSDGTVHHRRPSQPDDQLDGDRHRLTTG